MHTIRLRITAGACLCLLTVPFASFAETHKQPTATSPNITASAPSSSAPAVSLREMNFAPGQAPAADQTPASQSAQQQTNPSSRNAPSLQDLGFPISETKGSPQEQARLDKRSHMLQVHQRLGLLTTIPLVASLATSLGAKGKHGAPGSPTGRDIHSALGALTAGMYFTSAYYAIRAPKIPGTPSRGLIRLHKALAWVHGPGMILTPVLGAIAYSQLSRGERVHGIAKYHSLAGYVTAAAYGAAILSVSIK